MRRTLPSMWPSASSWVAYAKASVRPGDDGATLQSAGLSALLVQHGLDAADMGQGIMDAFTALGSMLAEAGAKKRAALSVQPDADMVSFEQTNIQDDAFVAISKFFARPQRPFAC